MAECVGKLTLVDPHTLLGKLQVRDREGGREGKGGERREREREGGKREKGEIGEFVIPLAGESEVSLSLCQGNGCDSSQVHDIRSAPADRLPAPRVHR